MPTIGNSGLGAGHGDLDYIGGTTRVSSVQLFPYADGLVSTPLLGYSPTWDGLQFTYQPATTLSTLYTVIDGTINNYDPGDEYQQLELHNSLGANVTLTGMARGVVGKVVVLAWQGDHSLTLNINNAGSINANRFYALSSTADIVLNSGQSIVLVYAYQSSFLNTGWNVIGRLNDSPSSKWEIGTTFPGSPATNDRFFRTDLGFLCYYDGTRWLSANEFMASVTGTVSGAGGTVSDLQKLRSDYAPYFTRVDIATFVATTNNGTNYWNVAIRGVNLAVNSATNIYTFNTSADTVNVRTDHGGAPSTANPANRTFSDVSITVGAGAPGAISVWAAWFYRLIIT